MSRQQHTIAIDARSLRSSTGKYVEKLMEYLQKIDKDHDYLVLLKSADFDSWNPSNHRWQKVPVPFKEFTFDEQLGFLKQLNDLNADLVHFTMIQQPARYSGKTVTTIHDLIPLHFRNRNKNPLVHTLKLPAYKWLLKKVARTADGLITPSRYVRDELALFTGIQPNRITVTYESADKITAKPVAVAKLRNQEYLLYVGQAAAHKNLERLIDAFRLVVEQKPKLQLVLVGKINKEKKLLGEYASEHGVDNILFTDWVSEGEKRWLYEHAKAYVFPSLSEGFSLTGLEAMLYDLPLVSSDSTCLPEIYKNAAHYFDPTNTADMATKILDVINDKAYQKQLISNGTKLLKNYSWEMMAKETLEVYNRVLSSRH